MCFGYHFYKIEIVCAFCDSLDCIVCVSVFYVIICFWSCLCLPIDFLYNLSRVCDDFNMPDHPRLLNNMFGWNFNGFVGANNSMASVILL